MLDLSKTEIDTAYKSGLADGDAKGTKREQTRIVRMIDALARIEERRHHVASAALYRQLITFIEAEVKND